MRMQPVYLLQSIQHPERINLSPAIEMREDPRRPLIVQTQADSAPTAGRQSHTAGNQPWPIIPPIGLERSANNFSGMRPARYAERPASTANFIARAMRTGCSAQEIAVFNRM